MALPRLRRIANQVCGIGLLLSGLFDLKSVQHLAQDKEASLRSKTRETVQNCQLRFRFGRPASIPSPVHFLLPLPPQPLAESNPSFDVHNSQAF